MTWKSNTFNRTFSSDPATVAAVSAVVERHSARMAEVVADAERIAKERAEKLSSISDPHLRRSAAL